MYPIHLNPFLVLRLLTHNVSYTPQSFPSVEVTNVEVTLISYTPQSFPSIEVTNVEVTNS